MITLLVLICIWFFISVYKLFYKDNYDNFFYHAGVVIGGVVIAATFIFILIAYLP